MIKNERINDRPSRPNGGQSFFTVVVAVVVVVTLKSGRLVRTVLVIRGQIDPVSNAFSGVFFVPDSTGWLLPAIMEQQPFWSAHLPFGLAKVRFFLWTRQNMLLPRQLMAGHLAMLRSTAYSPQHPTKIFIHGFGQSAVSDFIAQAREAYLNKGDYNIIAVDWSRLARSPFYLTAASSTKEVGVATAQLIDFLVANTDGGTAKRFHVLGYSLGAHAAGWAGASLSVGTLSRITAFDPPFPGFEGPTGRRRLSRDDAAFVDVIHTAARPESARRGRAIGFETQLGHADFYPNGGSVQNGCLTRFIGLHRTGCSHRRSSQYFVASISGQWSFSSLPCWSYKAFSLGQCGDCRVDNTTCVSMGENVSTSASGTYYLNTSSTAPYSLD